MRVIAHISPYIHDATFNFIVHLLCSFDSSSYRVTNIPVNPQTQILKPKPSITFNADPLDVAYSCWLFNQRHALEKCGLRSMLSVRWVI